jgi:hypothetical protein
VNGWCGAHERMALVLVVMVMTPPLCGIVAVARAQVPPQTSAIDFDTITFSSTRTRSGTVKFSHGEYRERIAPGSASELVVTLTAYRAIGVVNGEPTAGLVMATDLGGSGTFYDLALLIKNAEGWTHVDTQFLGDRVKIESVVLRGNELTIDMATHDPQDPLCCPTRRVKRMFAIDTGRLVAVETHGEGGR